MDDMLASTIVFIIVSQVFVIVLGCLMTFLPITLKKRKQRRCNQLVDATCVALEPLGGDGQDIEQGSENPYQLVDSAAKIYYEAQLNGQTIKFCNGAYTAPHPDIGESVRLMVNPENPNDYYVPGQRKPLDMALVVFGILTLIAGLYGLFSALFSVKEVI